MHMPARIHGDATDSRDYAQTRARVHDYFDRTATSTWERLTSDAPVSRVRQTVRAGRDRMREVLLSGLGADLTGRRVLDAGCGTGTMALELARRGAEVVAIDLSENLIETARTRHAHPRITWAVGDMTNPALGRFDGVVGMDSMIYYTADDLALCLGRLAPRVAGPILFTLAPRSPLLMTMWRVGKMFPRKDRSPIMVPQSAARVASALRTARVPGRLKELERITSGFYISTAFRFDGGAK